MRDLLDIFRRSFGVNSPGFKNMPEDDQVVVIFFLVTALYTLSLVSAIVYAVVFLAWFIVVPLGALGLFMFVFTLWSYYGARYNIGWFTIVKEGTGKEIVVNDNFVDYLPNRSGRYYDRADHKMKPATNGEDAESWLTKYIGLRFIGWNPFRKVRTLEIQKRRLKGNLDKIWDIREKIEIDKKPTTVDHLLDVIEWPILLLDVDLADGTRLYVLVKGVYEVHDPYHMLESLKGKFFGLLDSTVKAYILSVYRGLFLDDLRTSKMDLDITGLTGRYDIQTIVGLAPRSLVVEEWSLSDKDRVLQEARQAERVAQENGKAIVAKANADAIAALTTGKAEAKVAALQDQARVAGDIKFAKTLTAQLGQSGAAHVLGRMQTPGVTTLVEGGGVSMMLPTDQSPKPKQEDQPTTKERR